ncbi:MAG: adenylate/guanylate cyclase domain-containing protein, partial [Fidelibacterota bacterium]
YKDRWRVRSAVNVSTSMEPIIGSIRRNLYASVGVGVLTIVLVAAVLRIFMKLVVLKPLALIGGTARQVGEGNLAVRASVTSQDEIGVLAQEINRMIQGLRERLHLTKFVSAGTIQAVETADLQGVTLGGVRKEATVLFSDIRGFTAYSEKVEPEHVVEMLNTILNEQAQIVREYHGDIDKFVGDELMAVFQGDTMVEDAVSCAVALQKRVALLNETYEVPTPIGIGINAGPMIMGAVGSVDRMDYTVLGDAVNLGSRLCSSAGPGEILLSSQTADLLPQNHPFKLNPRNAISLKGKTEAVPVVEVIYDSWDDGSRSTILVDKE